MLRRLLAAISGVSLLSSCGTSVPAAPKPALNGSITVFAAASLTAAFRALGADFEMTHSGTTVRFTFAGSSTLAAQIQQGAIGDVIASADQPNMQKLLGAGLIAGTAKTFARNRLQIVVAAGNPKRVTGLADLARGGLVTVLCAPVVPCGRYALEALEKAGVTAKASSQEADVKAVLSKVALGEADVGIVYVSDIKAAGQGVQGVDIPENQNVTADYPIAVLQDAPNPALGRAFVEYALTAGQPTLVRYGFISP